MYSSQSLNSYPKCKDHILLLHAITGCDTTSAFYQRGKTKVLKLFEKCHDLVDFAKVFKNPDSSSDIILINGIRFILLYMELRKKLIL